ncbi:Dabb family protein [Sneathiella litorea]|uniref:Dabb family protein n=1 Tax=Sneathiella litorea TaxID=2606216 RepID=A0A6L8W838_9PROT|nr:Dabb family protein [Sneathiella litorea]MZR30693.1 Dabb family protein [Sneathiella litorea]
MIKHIVFFSAKHPENIPVIKEAFSKYRDIPSVSKIEVSENSKRDGLSDDIDIVLYVEFESVEALEEYKRHPIYKAGTDTVRPLRKLRFVVDFDADD